MKSKFLLTLLFWTIVICLVYPNNAHAYLDMGTFSMVMQMLTAVIIGSLFFIKIFWTKIKQFFSFLFSVLKRK